MFFKGDNVDDGTVQVPTGRDVLTLLHNTVSEDITSSYLMGVGLPGNTYIRLIKYYYS